MKEVNLDYNTVISSIRIAKDILGKGYNTDYLWNTIARTLCNFYKKGYEDAKRKHGESHFSEEQEDIQNNSTIVDRAKRLAEEIHKEQKYEDAPYWQHLYDVVDVLNEHLGCANDEKSNVLRAAAWLHDAMETSQSDEEATKILEKIINIIDNQEVTTIVAFISNYKPDRVKERENKLNYVSIRGSKGALAVKLSERIAEIRRSRHKDLKKFILYLQEWPEFKRELFHLCSSDPLILSLEKTLSDEMMRKI